MAALNNDRTWPVFGGRRVLAAAAALGVLGLGATAIAIALDPRRALLGYLAAYAAAAGAAIGVLILLLAGHAANARWPAPLRRLHESVTIAFPALAVLFLPIALGLDHLYPWADPPPDLTSHELHLLDAKRAWLAPAPFLVRSALYLAVFLTAAELLRRWSRRRDAEPPRTGEDAARRERRFAAAMLPPVGLAATFAAFDWLMSLQPAWVSSMFGIYYFAAGFCAGIALVVLLAWHARDARTAATFTPPHFHALGRLLFGFVVFWAYTAYFQGFLIQIADRPSEVTFYLARMHGGWEVVLWVILALRFALPFALLLPRRLKLRPRYLAAVAGLVVLGHLVEMYWLVVPSAGGPLSPHPADLTALAGIAGACVAWSAWRQRGVPIVPTGDPYLDDGLRYHSPN